MAAKSPASEGMAGRGDVPIRATACCTVSIQDCTQLASRGFPRAETGQSGSQPPARQASRVGGQTAQGSGLGPDHWVPLGGVGVNDLAVGHRLAWRQPAGLGVAPVRGDEGSRERGGRRSRCASDSCGAPC